jgi:hypothetical protein
MGCVICDGADWRGSGGHKLPRCGGQRGDSASNSESPAPRSAGCQLGTRPTAKVDQKLPECPWAEDLLTYNTHGGASPRSRQKARNLPALALLKRMLHEDSRIAGGGDSVANEQESLYFVESPTTLSLGTPAEPAPSMPPRMATPSLDGPRERRAPCLSSAISRDRAAFRSGIAAPSSPRPPLA